MKIKTITCHEVYNHGASLQEYALLRFLKQLGFDAEAIHYKPDYLSNHFSIRAISNAKFDKPIVKQLYLLAKLPGRLNALKRKRSFDEFHQKYIPTNKTLYTNNDELRTNLPDADVFICGSDQIWNSFFQNGKDPAFYLNFVPDSKLKISYAASFAIDKLDESVKPLVRDNVSRLNAIGVRETSGLKILADLGIYDAVQVLDPVFLLDVSDWRNFVKPIDEEFIFVYDFDSNPIIKNIAKKLKKEKGCKIFTVNKNIEYADQNYWDKGPEKFLSLISQSQHNITNSFHAVAFSMIFEKQLTVVNRSEQINTRMLDLLTLFGLEKHIVSKMEHFESLNNIDFFFIKDVKKNHINRSKQFLIKNLS